MKSLYQPISRKKRAAYHRQAALECARAGMKCIAQVNHEMAEWLDPTPVVLAVERPRRRRPEAITQPPLKPSPALLAPTSHRREQVQRANHVHATPVLRGTGTR